MQKEKPQPKEPVPGEFERLQEQLQHAAGEVGKSNEFADVWTKLGALEKSGTLGLKWRLLKTLNGVRPVRGEELSQALDRLSDVAEDQLPTAVELTRLNMYSSKETLGFDVAHLTKCKSKYTKKLYVQLKTLELLGKMNAEQLPPPNAELIPKPTAFSLWSLQENPDSLGRPSKVFNQLFTDRSEMNLTPSGDQIDSYLRATGFTEDQMSAMWEKPQQKMAIWLSRVKSLREGFPSGEEGTFPDLLQ